MEEMQNCHFCKAPFIKKRGCQKYCSIKCYNDKTKESRLEKYAKEKKKITFPRLCKTCGKVYESSHKLGRFCSQRCKESFIAKMKAEKWAKGRGRYCNRSFNC